MRDNMEISESIKILKALADSSRLMIINSLIQKAQYVEELAQRLNLAVSTVSFHLKKLESANLVYKKKEQYYVVFHINEEIFNYTLKEMISFENNYKKVQDERIQNYRDKVLNTFFDSGKLRRMPSQSKKRLIILDEIIKIFDINKIYSEKEIDSMIGEIFDDYCTIRRYFVDEKMMFRKKGEYRLNLNYRGESSSSIPFLKLANDDVKKRKIKKHLTKTAGQNIMSTRSEIKRNYKMTHPPMGVYQIKNKLNDNIYFGSSVNLNAIINRHKAELNIGIHKIDDLKQAWNMYGEDGVIFEIIDKLEPKEDPDYNYTEDLATLKDLWSEKLKESKKNYFKLHGTSIKNKL